MPREAFLSGLSKSTPRVNSAELNRRLKASFENSDVALTDMKFEPIGRDGNAVYFSMRMNMRVGESSRPISGVSAIRSEEHTTELQSLMSSSYAVFCLKKKNKKNTTIAQ